MSSTTTSLSFSSGHGGGSTWEEALETTLMRLGEPAPGSNLGIVYASDSLVWTLDAVIARLRQHTGIERWVGCVGMGVMGVSVTEDFRGEAEEYFAIPALSVLTMRVPRDGFRLLPSMTGDEAVLSEDTNAWLKDAYPALGLVHADPRQEGLAELLGDLAEQSGYLVGGLSSAQGAMPVIGEQIEEGVTTGVLFSADLGVATSLSQGCTPIGPARAVTKVQQNLLLELDGGDALSALFDDIGSDDVEHLRQVANSLHVALPVPGSDRADYTVRNFTSIDLAKRTVGISAMPDPGDRVLFCRRDVDAAREDLRRMVGDISNRLNGPPKGGIYVSCLARGPNLFEHNEELRIIREGLGDFPVAGFFANGEIAHNRLYGYTGVLTVFS